MPTDPSTGPTDRGRWPRLYALVLAAHVVVLLLLWWLTTAFNLTTGS